MTKTNSEIVREYIEAINHNDFDHVWDYCSPDYVVHISPYVGLGINGDDTSGEHLIILGTAPGGPAHGVLLPGDELIRVTDGSQVWSSSRDLSIGLWGQGIPGTPLTLTVIRNGQALDLELVRGYVKGWGQKLSDFIDSWRAYKLRVWPDLRADIQFLFENDDLVAFYAIDSGTNMEYHRAAMWGECSIFRVRDGKIVESWGAENDFSQMKQLGYDIREPQLEPAP